jgi:hypothetical protein
MILYVLALGHELLMVLYEPKPGIVAHFTSPDYCVIIFV